MNESDSDGCDEIPFEDNSLKHQCLFCTNETENLAPLLDHMSTIHKFQLIPFSYASKFDTFSYLKFINYVREKSVTPEQLNEIIEKGDFKDEQYLKPIIQNDVLLTLDIENDESDDDELNDDNQENDVTTAGNSCDVVEMYRRKVTELAKQIDRMRTFVHDLVENHGDDDKWPSSGYDINTSNVRQSSACKKSTETGGIDFDKNSDDEEYFENYAHFSIHYEMLIDKQRTESYMVAINNAESLMKGATVLDIGCGTGILSMFAAKAGAHRVIAVDKSDIIKKASKIIEENHLNGIIKMEKCLVEDLNLSKFNVEKVDVIISEWMGYFLLFEGMIDSILYARYNCLKDDGLIMPNRTAIFMAGCESRKCNERLRFWDDVYGFRMSAMKDTLTKEVNVEVVGEEEIITNSVVINEIDLMTCEPTDVYEIKSDFKLECQRESNVNAFVCWFNCYFDFNQQTTVLNTSPFVKPTHWKQCILPLQSPLNKFKGENIEGTIEIKRNLPDTRSLKVRIKLKDSVCTQTLVLQ